MIEMAGVVVAGRKQPLLDGCSLNVQQNEIHALVGPREAGKSVALDILLGLRQPSRGISQILGLDCFHRASEIRAKVTYIPEAGYIDPQLSPRQFLAWVLRLVGHSFDSVAIRRALRLVEIPDRFFDVSGRHIPADCRILTWIALARLRQHRVLLMDDPTPALDLSTAARLRRVLLELKNDGCAILIATRDTRFAGNVADAVTFLESGRMLPISHKSTGSDLSNRPFVDAGSRSIGVS